MRFGEHAGVREADSRRVEILADGEGAPRLSWCGTFPLEGPAFLSISHCAGWIAAAVSSVGPIGVDVEEVARRRPQFYQFYFSDAERRWMLDAPATERDRLGMLLWTIKEAFLKTGCSAARSVWEMHAVEVRVSRSAGAVATDWPTLGSECLASVDVNLQVTDRALRPRVAYGGVGPLVLGIVALTRATDASAASANSCLMNAGDHITSARGGIP